MLYFLIPVYNEEGNLPELFANLSQVMPSDKKFFVFSDDGSRDNSTQLIKTLFKDTDFIVLGDGSNHGPGYAFNTGFEWIIANSIDSEDRIVSLEADNTSDLEILPHMLTISRLGYDFVLASVYAQGGGFDKTSFFRKMISFTANIFLRLLFDIKVLTLSSFYRVYKVGTIKRVKEKYGNIITETGFISMIEILIKGIRVKAKIIEVPMLLHSSKRVGKSKMKVFKTMMSYVRFVAKSRY